MCIFSILTFFICIDILFGIFGLVLSVIAFVGMCVYDEYVGI